MNLLARYHLTAERLAQLSLTILFAYSSIIKLIDTTKYRRELLQSPLLPVELVEVLVYGLPIIEILIILVIAQSHHTVKRMGYVVAFFLMMLFSLYLLVLTTAYSNIPCACGGILGGMSYPVHIAFNIFFTLVALVGIYTNANDTNEHSAPHTA